MKLRKYSGFPPWTNGEFQTCTAFINSLEENFDYNSIPTFLNKWLQGPALDWWTNFEHNNNDWNITKQEFILKFHSVLSVKEKVNIRQSLKQNPEESVEDFLDRCTCAQYAITDDADGIISNPVEAGFERDILLNFLLGMNQELQCHVISSNERSLEGFFNVALKIEEEKIRENENKNEILESAAVMQQQQRPKRKRKKPKVFDEDKIQCQGPCMLTKAKTKVLFKRIYFWASSKK